MDFYSAYDQGFVRVVSCTSRTHLGDPRANAVEVIEHVRRVTATTPGVGLMVFPELTLSGYSMEDLFLQDAVLDGVLDGLESLVAASADLLPVLVVGAPLQAGSRLFNCAVVIHRGQVLGVVPKSYLPTYREFYERRWFASGEDETGTMSLLGAEVPFGPDLVFHATDVPGLMIHVEICEDYWVPVPPSSEAALAGATVLVNLSGSPITIAKAEERHLLARSQSTRCVAAYIYAAAGPGESSTDLSWDGQTMIYEGGTLLAETERFPEQPGECVADIDLEAIRQDRMRQGTLDDNARHLADRINDVRRVEFVLDPPRTDIGLIRRVERFPFVPSDAARLAQDCYEGYNIQVFGLEQRIRAIGNTRPVIGVSGGLDSTHALLVAAHAMDRLGRPRSDIIAITMPGFATSEHTLTNATRLATALGCTFEEIDIRPACLQMLRDMKHAAGEGAELYDVTFENVQAGMRYDYLFRIANQRGGIVVGTGDLSELALGWCTYGVGDQMSHYGVNTGVPKTLIQHLIRWVIASGQFDAEVTEVLESILNTEITPELVPPRPGEAPQSTEASIGPYELHDNTLFHLLRRGLRPSRIAFLQWHAWRDAAAGDWPPGFPEEGRHQYDLATIRSWLEVFIRRFVANQFKRSALPNGPKVLRGGSLSPRGDWRMPSDARPVAWLEDLADVPEG
ncbi:MAG TPA: NAD(+) synthase [Propionibacteriaceae bacterium]|nr:NAD(+) synthase [Propionibacteriaceae bacterium]